MQQQNFLKEDDRDDSATPPKHKRGKSCLAMIFTSLAVLLAIILITSSNKKTNGSYKSSRTPSNEDSVQFTETAVKIPSVPIGKRNALSSAISYLSVMAFSYNKLVTQLEYEGYSSEEATYGADYCGADWYEQAAKSAKEYLDTMSFSKSGLIEQLKYDGFTESQAQYGAAQNGY